MLSKPLIIIAIDGPAGSGKTTVAKKLSKELNILYLSTGAMYRAVGLIAIREKLDLLNKQAVNNFVKKINIEIKYYNNKQHIFANKEDVSDLIYDKEVSEMSSKVSNLPQVRSKVVASQQKFANKESLVVDGRDITTVVFKDAKYKFYLDAKVEERAKRRFKEYKNKGLLNNTYEDILLDIKKRDKRDISRKNSPLKVAEDAIHIDSTNMSVEQVVQVILKQIKN